MSSSGQHRGAAECVWPVSPSLHLLIPSSQSSPRFLHLSISLRVFNRVGVYWTNEQVNEWVNKYHRDVFDELEHFQ